MSENQALRLEKMSLLIGTTVGQISELLNQICKYEMKPENIYKSLLDIHQMAALQLHELYFKKEDLDASKSDSL